MKRHFQIGVWTAALIVAFVSIFPSSAVLNRAVAQKKAVAEVSPAPSPTPQQIQPGPLPAPAVPLPQIVTRADELMQQLREMNDRLTLDSTVSSTDETLRSQEVLIAEKQHGLHELIAITPTRDELLERELEWVGQKELYSTLSRKLTDRAKAIGEDVHFLEIEQLQWGAALNQPGDPAAIAAVSERVREVLGEIANTSKRASEALRSLLLIQDRVSDQERLVVEALRSISQAKSRLQRSLLHPDSPPIWKAPVAPSEEILDRLVSLSFKRNLIRTQQFLSARRNHSLGLLFLFLFVLVASIASGHRIRAWSAAHPDTGSMRRVFERPVSLALLIVLIVLLPFLPVVPFQVRATIVVLSLVPVLRLLAPLTKPVFSLFVYVLVVFGTTSAFWETAVPSPAFRRWGVVVLSLGAISCTVWLTVRARRDIEPSARRAHRTIVFIRLATAAIVVSLIANIFGYVALSRVLRSATVLSCYTAVILFTAYSSAALILLQLFRMRRGSSTSDGVFRGEAIVRWTLRFLKWAALYVWIYGTLNLFGIREAVWQFITAVLTTPIKLRAASFTPGDILTFILVLVAGIALTSLIRVVLREGILSRLSLKHGIPYAISTITYYLLLLFVFLLALSAAGVELSKFTVLTGAFGIGAGFGLQNVISNFVAGIILLFERPIRIGDFLEVDNRSGEVVRLGIRSSSMRTPQGAEVIVPNSNLISNQVVNWTLSEQKRSATLLIKVAYGADPEKVRDLLLETITSHPDVVSDPAPLVFFLGFGDNSLDFELIFWVPDFTLRKKVSSEIAIRIAHEFREAGIDLPAPKRELLVTGINASMKDSSGEGESKDGPATEARIDLAASEQKQ